MIRTIMNTLREGDARVKNYLIAVIVLWLAVLGVAGWSLWSGSVLGGAAAVLLALIACAVMSNLKLTQGKSRNGKKRAAAVQKKHQEAGRKSMAEEAHGNRETEEPLEPEEDLLTDMTEETLQRLFVKYKVKQEHVPVILDLCIPDRVRQCPGFAWVEKDRLKLLLIDSQTRLLERELSEVPSFAVERGVAARAAAEYPRLRETVLMKELFTPYLPRYHKKEIGGRIVLFKNLYVLGNDLKFTSGSVRSLLKLLPVPIELKDRRMEESSVSTYYKELFTVSFLWKDGIYTLDEFKEKLEGLLRTMAEVDISYQEFENDLSEMISDGLLPMEYREYAYRLREEKKNPAKQEAKKGWAGRKKKK